MEVGVATRALFFGLNTEIRSYKRMLDFRMRLPCSHRLCFYSHMHKASRELSRRKWNENFAVVQALAPGVEDVLVSTTSFKGVSIVTNKSEDREIKMRINVFGTKTQAIFDDVFAKMVEAAQPIPGFRRVKGGKTPDIPKDVLLHILGPSKVNKQSIKKIINSTVADYVKKEDLKVTKNLRVEQSYEDLESTFEPGKDFSFDAVIQLTETDKSK